MLVSCKLFMGGCMQLLAYAIAHWRNDLHNAIPFLFQQQPDKSPY